MSHLKLEQLKYTALGSTQIYFKVWQPFLSYFEIEFPSINISITMYPPTHLFPYV